MSCFLFLFLLSLTHLDENVKSVSDKLGEKSERVLKSSINKMFPEEGGITSIELVAWACKIQGKGLPDVFEEAVIVVKMANQKATWKVVSLVRMRASDHLSGWSGNMKWHPNDADGVAGWISNFPERPGANAIAEFINDSNFGKNEVDSDVELIYVSVGDRYAKKIKEVIDKGIGAEEKNRRRNLQFKLNYQRKKR